VATTGTSWDEYRKYIEERLGDLKSLEEKVETLSIKMAVLKTQTAMMSACIGLAFSLVGSYLVKQFGGS
jgi:hypothetical protein